MKQIGILGGGQLGLLLSESIYRLGGNVKVYDPDRNAPLCKRSAHATNSSWTDVIALEQFIKGCDAVTYEFENVESAALFTFEKDVPILPGVKVLKTTQDRSLEKTFLSESGLPHVDFAVVNSLTELQKTARTFGYPLIIKSARGGYDGKGQALIAKPEELAAYVDQTGHDEDEASTFRAVLERVLDIDMEVSCIVARSPLGEEATFPVLENVHRDHILDLTIVPARISAPLEKAITEIALNAARSLGAFGLTTTEFFLSKNPGKNASGTACGGWYIYINELAPRPHNSGHVTMKACTYSQFDALARILIGVPLAQPYIVAPGYFCMANLLGDIWLSQGSTTAALDLSTMRKFPEVLDLVLYGKEEPRAKRKMGHVITYSNSAQGATASAIAFRQSLVRNAGVPKAP